MAKYSYTGEDKRLKYLFDHLNENVKEYEYRNDFPVTGEVDTIYIADDENTIYRWDGSNYVEIGGGDTNTTYTFEGGTNGFTVTPSDTQTPQTVSVTPEIQDNITGSGTAGKLAKFSGANAIEDGPAIGSGTTTYLRNDGQWSTPPGTYELPEATSQALGGIKVGYTQNNKNYPVQLDSQKAFVNVPWIDTTYTFANGANGGFTVSDGTNTNTYMENVPNVTTDNQTPTVDEASTRSNLASGDTLKTIIGKIKKWFSDLKAIAFSGSYNDLVDTPTIPTVGDGTLTITQNGVSKGTFTANQSGPSNVALTDTTYSDATTTASGLMSRTDKSKLNTLTQDFRGIVTVEAADSFVAGWRRFAKITASGNYGSALLAFRGGWSNNAPYVGTVLYTIRNNEAKLRILDGFGQPNNVHQKLRAVRISANNFYLEMYRSATSNANSKQYCDIVPISGTQNWTVTETSDTPPINNNATGAYDYEISLMDEQFMPYATNTGYIGTADKAWKEGYINNLHGDVDGSATKLTKTETVLSTDKVPYVSRASLNPEGFSGYIREKIVGGSVGWNQNIYNGNFVDTSKWVFASSSTVSASNNILTMTANTAGSLLSAYPDTAYRNTWQVGHKILATLDAKTSTSGLAISASLAYGTVTKNKIKINFSLTSSWQTISNIVNITEATEGIRIAHANSSAVAVGDAYQIRNVYAVDLTILFGSVIADYIYNLESSTAGVGVSLLRSLGFFTEPYYEYDAGSIQSVCTKEKKIVGFNQWDEVWELGNYNASGQPIAATDRIRTKNYIPVLPNTDYYFYCATTGVGGLFYFYDANKEFISSVEKGRNTIFTTPQNACYLRFRMYSNYGTAYKNDICINISDTSKNGTYEPYHLDTIPLSATELRGIPKLDSNNNVYYDGDEYTSDGKIQRKYGIVNLGTLDWTITSNNRFSSETISTLKNVSAWNSAKSVCAIYKQATVSSSGTNENKIYGIYGQKVYVNDTSYTDAASFKTSMDGVYLVYELATPTEENVLSYQNPQYAKDGTEEFVDGKTRDMIVPVGHVTEYMGETAGEYQVMPTMPVDDGKYVLTADNNYVVWESNKWKKIASQDVSYGNNIYIPYQDYYGEIKVLYEMEEDSPSSLPLRFTRYYSKEDLTSASWQSNTILTEERISVADDIFITTVIVYNSSNGMISFYLDGAGSLLQYAVITVYYR